MFELPKEIRKLRAINDYFITSVCLQTLLDTFWNNHSSQFYRYVIPDSFQFWSIHNQTCLSQILILLISPCCKEFPKILDVLGMICLPSDFITFFFGILCNVPVPQTPTAQASFNTPFFNRESRLVYARAFLQGFERTFLETLHG